MRSTQFTALRSGGLRIEPALRIKHYHAPSSRDGDFDVGRMSLLNYWHLMRLFGRPSWRLAGLLVLLLIGYHLFCYKLMRDFAQNRNAHSAKWYRGFNEVPSLLLIAIVLLAVVKPF